MDSHAQNYGTRPLAPSTPERAEAILRVVSLEYEALQSELRDRMNSRFQTLLIVAGAAGLVAGFAPANSRLPDGLLYAGAAAIAIGGVITWLTACRRAASAC